MKLLYRVGMYIRNRAPAQFGYHFEQQIRELESP